MQPDKQFSTILELAQVFPDEQSCHLYLAQRRWKDGEIICPHCSHNQAYVFKDQITYKCTKCHLKFTAKTDTFMEGSKLPSIKWIYAMYLFLHKKGLSSPQLSKDIGVTQKTAWFMLQRIRWALGNDSEEPLDGIVEIDETFVGGKSKNKHKDKRMKYNPGREFPDKVPVIGMIKRGSMDSRGYITPSRVVAVAIDNIQMLTITKAVRKHVKLGSNIMGDGFTAYRVLEKYYHVRQVDHSKGWYVDGECHTNTIENFWSGFKKGIIATYHKTTRKHLNKYVQEFAFRHNYRNLGVQGQIDQIINNMVCRLKYKELIA